MSKQADYNSAYWASKPPQVRELGLLEPGSKERLDKACSLAAEGFLIDLEIDGWALDPFIRQSQRIAYMYTWWPSALQAPIPLAPGLFVPSSAGLAPYDPLHPPAGSIKVSINLADYPSWDKPKVDPPTIGSALSPVAQQLHDVYYASQPWDHYDAGAVTGAAGVPADPRGEFLKMFTPSIFGQTGWWRKR